MPRMDADGDAVVPEVGGNSPYGEDHTIGTGNSYLEDPMQGVQDLADATDGDGSDGGFADPASWFVGVSDPDGDGEPEETAAGHEVDLPDSLPSSTGSGSGSGVLPSTGSRLMAVVAVVVAVVAAIAALAGVIDDG
ncbi:hypothetical protein LPA44_04090 [Halobacterium sp. KA-4]|uniref:hypothetical protein n=1 Tax=Halobacterium sp. KA-4 TaxID=2896367 RepID=UPI001E5A4BCB|nr:hypothetical protein [Halobacterium sp. KA-4]MCD2199079.1 hypothetical protein [Halobacterium sp. KA-4]